MTASSELMDGRLPQVSAIRYRMMEMMAITLDILWKGINPRPSQTKSSYLKVRYPWRKVK